MKAIRNDWDEFLREEEEELAAGIRPDARTRELEELLIELQQKNIALRESGDKLAEAAGLMTRIQERLNEVEQQLQMTLHTGPFSKSVH